MKTTKTRYFVVFLLFVVTAINYMDRANLAIAGSKIQGEFALSATQLGLLFSMFTWTYAASQIPVGYLLDRIGSRVLYGSAILVWSTCTFAMGFASHRLFATVGASFAVLLVCRSPDVPPSRFGWLFGLNAGAMIAMSQVNGHLLKKHTPEQLVSWVRPVSLIFALALIAAAFTGFGGMWGVLVPLFFILGSFGFIGPNTMAGGLNVDPRRAGSISALMGGAQFGFGALASSFTGLSHDNGPRPLSLAVMICMAGSAAALFGLALRKSPEAIA